MQCEHCSQQFEPGNYQTKRFCTRRCQERAQERRRYLRRRQEKIDAGLIRPREARQSQSVCHECGTTAGIDWWHGRYRSYKHVRYRCQPCYLSWLRLRYYKRTGKSATGRAGQLRGAIEKRRVGATAVCSVCESDFTVQHWNHFRCSLDCHKLRSRIAYGNCATCGVLMLTQRHHAFRRYCSVECLKPAMAAKNRRKNAKRRGARVGKPYTLADVVARDGKKCHLCRKVVDVSLPGTDRMGPTIDHLVPIADGGLDELANVRLAHRACNCARGRGGDVQLLLFG